MCTCAANKLSYCHMKWLYGMKMGCPVLNFLALAGFSENINIALTILCENVLLIPASFSEGERVKESFQTSITALTVIFDFSCSFLCRIRLTELHLTAVYMFLRANYPFLRTVPRWEQSPIAQNSISHSLYLQMPHLTHGKDDRRAELALTSFMAQRIAKYLTSHFLHLCEAISGAYVGGKENVSDMMRDRENRGPPLPQI